MINSNLMSWLKQYFSGDQRWQVSILIQANVLHLNVLLLPSWIPLCLLFPVEHFPALANLVSPMECEQISVYKLKTPFFLWRRNKMKISKIVKSAFHSCFSVQWIWSYLRLSSIFNCCLKFVALFINSFIFSKCGAASSIDLTALCKETVKEKANEKESIQFYWILSDNVMTLFWDQFIPHSIFYIIAVSLQLSVQFYHLNSIFNHWWQRLANMFLQAIKC